MITEVPQKPENILMYDLKLLQLGMHSKELRAVVLIDISPILHSSYAGSNWKELKCPPPDDRETRCSRPSKRMLFSFKSRKILTCATVSTKPKDVTLRVIS